MTFARSLAVIAARGGSKGLPNKHLLEIEGRPVIAWSVEAAMAARKPTQVVVSTDCADIAAAARAAGGDTPFLRPPDLAGDDTPVEEVVLHAVDALGGGFDAVILLQATSPLRRSEDIDGAIALYAESAAETCIAVAPLAKPLEWIFTLDAGGRVAPVAPRPTMRQRRQDATRAYAPNGAVYISSCEGLRRRRSFYGDDVVAYVMPPERSVDIDVAADLDMARRYARLLK